ncbi:MULTISPECIES: segregation and condensation protein A [unclassified Ligilactobacillus]|uniref:segregation and condensation protein A n=1 Tax=unclassified Ligilactobacillus TaxID=2767920 RepID=UPI0038541AA2
MSSKKNDNSQQVPAALTLKLEQFEGPLDLLLHLIKKNKVDIYDIPVAKITSQYVAYLHQMKELRLDIAGEYLVMAATLVNIKSRMLLPQQHAQDEPEEEEDPRVELVNQLVVHQQFQRAAAELGALVEKRSGEYGRPEAALPADAHLGQLAPAGSDILTQMQQVMLKMTQRAVNRRLSRQPRQVKRERYTVKHQMTYLRQRLRRCHKVEFMMLFSSTAAPEQYVTTFMALLELMRRQDVVAEQAENYGPIMISEGRHGNKPSKD